MFLEGFSLEILVDGVPLKEYTESVQNIKMTTGPSYIRPGLSGERLESESHHYVEVPASDVRYSVRYSVLPDIIERPIVTRIYVDGIYDRVSCTLQKSISKIKDGFWTHDRSEKTYFKFSSPSCKNRDKKSGLNNESGSRGRVGLGAVSAYFFRGERQYRITTNNVPFDLKSAPVEETDIRDGIEMTTSYDTCPVERPSHLYSGLKKTRRADLDPVAVLHIHYRTRSWLISRGLIVPDETVERPLVKLRSSRINKANAITDQEIVEDGTDFEFVVSVDDLTAPSFYRVPQKRKRCRRIIESSDSDDTSVDLNRTFTPITKNAPPKDNDESKIIEISSGSEEE